MKLLHRLWRDEAGFIISAELVLVATMLVIGMIVGLTVLRNQVVQELGDLGAALGMISQGYYYTGVQKFSSVTYAQTDGSSWDDLLDDCQLDGGNDIAGGAPSGIEVPLPAPPANNPGEQS